MKSLKQVRQEVEIVHITVALEAAGWNRKLAAKLLQVSYRNLMYKLKQYGINATGTVRNSDTRSILDCPRTNAFDVSSV